MTVCLSLVCVEINFPKRFAKIVATEEKQLVVYIIPLSINFQSCMYVNLREVLY